MKISTPEICDSSERGTIKDILVGKQVDGITVITSNKGVVRGNHYHKETVQWVYLQSGSIKSLSQMEGEPVKSAILKPGDLLENVAFEKHALVALEDSMFYVLTQGPRSGIDYEQDTYRLDVPLKDPEGE